MKYLSIQIQPDSQTNVTEQELKFLLEKNGYTPEIETGNDDGPYINILTPTDNLKKLWVLVQGFLNDNNDLKKHFIVTCEGSRGWDNYLLLHSPPKSEKLDEL